MAADTMRAALVTDGGRFEVSEVPRPAPDADQVLVEIAACGICGTDIHLQRSGFAAAGMIMGHECSGTVVEVGSEADPSLFGKQVAIMPYLPCGDCAACRVGRPQLCPDQYRTGMGLGPRPGGLAQFVAVWPDQLFELPEGVSAEAGALAEPLAVGMHGVERSGVTEGDHAVVLGGGSIGVMTALALGAARVVDVVVSEPSDRRRAVLSDLGLTAVSPAELARVADSPAVVFDATGAGPGLAEAVWTVRPGGTVVILGVVEKPVEILPAQWLLKEIDVRTALAYGDCFPDAVAALGEGHIDIDALSGSRMPLELTGEAFDLLASTEAPPKILITP